ncbi:MAG: glutamate-1-semialdehyde 2,1-aminomutase [Fibrobacter sp.]|nr:glutamate-1-semialdehyde 2,1-aminomutase [Fibrobacter sp.]
MQNTNRQKSETAFNRARISIPGGVNSPVRAFKGVGGTPAFIASGKGCHITDIDGNEYIDFVGSWGPLILGNAHPAVTEAISRTLQSGLSFGAPTEAETELAELITSLVPSVEMVRFVNSGTEATMSAIRLARGFTGRNLIIKFDGCYHGHADCFLIAAGSGAATLGVPDSPGVTPGTAGDTLLARFNDLQSVKNLFTSHQGKIAAVIVEPVVGNMGVILPRPEFLQGLRELTESDKSILIFDEVMTGFRVASGGAQELYGIKPDLTTFGKIIGGGLPVGAYGGSRKIMELISPSGPVYQAGTLSGNPLSVSAGLATLKQIHSKSDFYEKLEQNGAYLAEGLLEGCRAASVKATLNRAGSMMTLFFNSGEVTDADSARRSDTKLYGRFFHGMLDKGIYLAPSQFEASFLSRAHSKEDLDKVINAATEVLEVESHK